MNRKKIFVPSFDFKPQLGGVAHYAHEVLHCLHKDWNAEVYILAREAHDASTYDQSSPFHIERVQTPASALLSLPPWIYKSQQLIKKWQPDVLFCPLWFPDAAAIYCLQKMTQSQVPYFIAAHAMELLDGTSLKQKLRRQLLQQLRKNTLLNASGIFPVSDYTHRILAETLHVPPSLVKTIPNGINTQDFPCRTPYNQRARNPFHLLTVTRLHPYKGVDQVLISIAKLIQKGHSIQYTIIGEGPDLSRLKKLSQSLNISDSVHFLGRQPQKQIVDFYNRSHLFILLSREEPPDVEGFGLVFLEAASCGLPSVGGRSGGIPDAIDNDRSGWLVSPLSQQDISQQLEKLILNPEHLLAASNYCLEMVKNKSWSQAVKTIAESMHVF